MTSREKILQAVREGKPDHQPLPEPIGFASTYANLAEQFTSVLQSIGGKMLVVSSLEEVPTQLAQLFDLSHPTISLVEGLPTGNVSPHPTDDPHQFENLNLVVLRSTLGVAENGAVWLDEQNFTLRILPFIPTHLAVIIHEDELAGNMHDAYQRLSFSTGYGAFIAGPSKTADIEQSLVIGAHGPKSMTVFLLKKPSK